MGGSVAGGTPRSLSGLPIHTKLDFPEVASDKMKSWQQTVSAQATDILDVWIGGSLVGPTGVCYLAGGEYRCRTDAAEGSELEFSVVDRDDVLGYFSTYGMSVGKLPNLTSISGTFQVGETVSGNTSSMETTVLAVGADYLEARHFIKDPSTGLYGVFTDGETITGGTSSATAVLDTPAFDDGDVLELSRYVEDEWIEGFDIREIRPGGSKQLPQGLYFRIQAYNNHATDDLRVKTSLILATE